MENSEEGVYDGLRWLAEHRRGRAVNFKQYNTRVVAMFEAAMDGAAIEKLEPIIDAADSPWKKDYLGMAEDFGRELTGSPQLEEFLGMVRNLEYRVYLAKYFSGREPEFRPTESGVGRYLGEAFLGSAEKDFFRIRNIEMVNGLLRIEGSVGFYGLDENDEVEVELVEDAERHAAELSSRDHRRKISGDDSEEYGISMRVVVFKFSIPLEGRGERRFRIAVRFRGFEIVERPVYDKYSPIGSRYAASYYYSDGCSVRQEGDALVVESCSRERRAELERRLLAELEDGAPDAADMRRRAFAAIDARERSVWLINDRVCEAGDNGEALFRYISEEKSGEVDAFFVVDRSSDDYARMKRYGNVVGFGTDEHRELLLIADAVVSSRTDEIFRNTFGERSEAFRDLLHTPLILIEHGVSAGKDFHTWLHRSNMMISCFAVASQEERRQFSAEEYGYADDEVRVTGLPRFDRLYNSPRRVISVMPTWRKELVTPPDPATGLREPVKGFEQSAYAHFWRELMQDEKLNAAAARLGYSLVFIAHPNLRKHEDAFGFSPEVTVDRKDRAYRDVFAESSLVVTDYSGVAFDFAYLDKPVVYAQFDMERINHVSHTYADTFDYENRGFGEVETTVGATVDRLIEYMERGCVMKDEYRARVDELFAYRDGRNCERAYRAVINCIKEHGV